MYKSPQSELDLAAANAKRNAEADARFAREQAAKKAKAEAK